jgi:anthranilate synthase component 1
MITQQSTYETFRQTWEEGRPQVVFTRLVADLETPVSAFLKVKALSPQAFLLESVEGGAVRGRYSLIGLKPDLVWKVENGRAFICRNALAGPEAAFVADSRPPLESLRALLAESRMTLDPDLPPMAAGLFGYMGYDMVRHIERLPPPNPDPLGLPEALMIRPTIMAIFDAVRDEVVIVTPVWPGSAKDARAAWEAAQARLDEVISTLGAPVDTALLQEAAATAGIAPPVSNTTAEEYMAMVRRAKEYIAAGDIFQVVLSQRFETDFPLPAFSLYRALRRVNPSPFLYYLDFGDFALTGSSPEILVRVRNNRVTIRPIAGTRPRGRTREEDEALERELLADPKELAEHLMLLDLGRNDVGRVARIGSVRVTEKFVIERYSQVMHIVSNVEGELDTQRFDAVDALMAGFPAGTVSGAPKVRAMEIIDELEKERRGPYAGCVGYFSASGEMDSCIVLRTAIVRKGRMYVQAGAGIVADSVPENEQAECENKARALFRAAEEAARFAGAGQKERGPQ